MQPTEQMHPYLERFISNIRDCPICHFRSRGDICLCEPCYSYLLRVLKDQKEVRRNLDRWDHQWLLSWKSEQAVIGELVRHLKGGGIPSSFQMLARLFVSRRQIQILPGTTFVFPSKGRRDHGWAWAQGLSQNLGLPNQAIRLLSIEKQALKSRNQRKYVEFEPTRSKGPVIFVDDVVTTGATARAAFVALGRPKKFAIWSIFYRPPL